MKLAYLLPIFAMSGSPAAAAITIYSSFGYSDDSEFAVAAGPTQLIDFNSAPNGSFDGSSYTAGPLTLTGDPTGEFSNMEVVDNHVNANVCGSATCSTAFGYTLNFAQPITAFGGMFYGAATYSGLTFTVNGTSFAGPIYNYEFFGFTSDTSFYSIAVSGENEAHQFDDVRFASAVPEPASWLMLLTGFGVIGGAARRRSARSPALA